MNSLVGFGSISAFIISAVRPFLKANIEFSLALQDAYAIFQFWL